MKKSALLGVGAALVVCTALAAQVQIPHQFTAGTPARAGEVNANFTALADETNAHDTRLTALETSAQVVSAQMLCAGTIWFNNSPQIRCVRDTTPGTVEYLTYAEIRAEGWTAISIGGNISEAAMIFNKYTTE